MNKDYKQDQLFDYACLDWKIFPVYGVEDGICLCGNLECTDQGWHTIAHIGLEDATTDLNKIHEWNNNYPNANWAVATGAISNIIVVSTSFYLFKKELLDAVPLPYRVDATYLITSGEGYLYFFSYPGAESKWSTKNTGYGINIFADGEYVFLPPSLNTNGDEYRWVFNPKIIPMSENLMEFLRDMDHDLGKPKKVDDFFE